MAMLNNQMVILERFWLYYKSDIRKDEVFDETYCLAN